MLSQVGAPLRSYVAGGDFIANRDMSELGVKVGDRVPWRDLGIHEVRMHQMWRANMVECVAQAPVSANEQTVSLPGVASAELGEKLSRAERRAQRRQG
jgi:hypothetical protein